MLYHGNFYKHESGTTACKMGPSDYMEVTPALLCPDWPKKITVPFRDRSRKWPPSQLIDAVIRKGCHVIPKGHRSSSLEDVEWRLSFTLTEQKLFRSMVPKQHATFMIVKNILKICRTKCIKKHTGDGSISNYCLKTVHLWLSELKDVGWWENQNFIICSLTLLREFQKALKLH